MGNRLAAILATLSPQQRLIAFAGVGVMALLLVLGLVLALHGGGGNNKNGNQPNGYVTIFKHLDQKEQDEAAAALGAAHITKFQITQDGTLMVVKNKEAQARIALGEAKVPKNPDQQGLEIFNTSNFISTDFDKRIEYIRGLSGELTRWVRKVDGVSDANVLVNLPQDSLFQSEKKPVTAAVMVKLEAGRQLTTTQIEGIQHMIASAVPGLMVDNVTVVDYDGNLLSSGLEANSGNQGGQHSLSRDIDQQLRITNSMEIDLQNRLQSMLDKLLGPGKAMVQVALDLDFSHRAVRDELMQPVLAPNGAPLPAQRVVNNERSGGPGVGGPAGTYANVPSYPALAAAPGSSSSMDTTVKRFENDQAAFSKQDEIVQPASGEIKRMSIAVLLPDTVAPDQVDKLKNVIAAAAGADPARRDQVTVELVHFDDSLLKQQQAQIAADAAKAKLKPKGPVLGWKWVWIIGGIVLLGALILSLIFRRRRPAENPFEALTSSLESDALPGGFSPGASLGGFAPDQISGLGQPGAYGGESFGGPAMGASPYGQEMPQPSGMAAGPAGSASGSPFQFLYEVAPDQVAELLSQERPATAAGVLSQVDSNFAEAIIANLPPELQQDVFNRLSQGAPMPAMTQRMVAQNLRRKLGVPA